MGAGYLQLDREQTMANWCHFDPTTVPSLVNSTFSCPECGMMVMAGCSHPVEFKDGIEQDHAVLEWIEEHKDDTISDH